jgi:hypothetical protein
MSEGFTTMWPAAHTARAGHRGLHHLGHAWQVSLRRQCPPPAFPGGGPGTAGRAPANRRTSRHLVRGHCAARTNRPEPRGRPPVRGHRRAAPLPGRRLGSPCAVDRAIPRQPGRAPTRWQGEFVERSARHELTVRPGRSAGPHRCRVNWTSRHWSEDRDPQVGRPGQALGVRPARASLP